MTTMTVQRVAVRVTITKVCGHADTEGDLGLELAADDNFPHRFDCFGGTEILPCTACGTPSTVTFRLVEVGSIELR